MALAPCAVCGQRFRGPANRAYVAILDGVQKWEHKPRLCAIHIQMLQELFTTVDAELIDGVDKPFGGHLCLVCAKDVAGRLSQNVFMTSYTAHDERRDFFAPLCAGCRPSAEEAILGAKAAP